MPFVKPLHKWGAPQHTGCGNRAPNPIISSHALSLSADVHRYGDQQHVQSLEDHVAAVAHPDVAREGHEEEGGGLQAREGAQGQLPPVVPVHLGEADAVGRGSACRWHISEAETALLP